MNFGNVKKVFSVLTMFVLLFLVQTGKTQAASASFSTSGGGTVNMGTTIKVSVNVTASEAYNASTVNVNFTNLTYVSATAGSGWTAITGPSASGSSVSFTGAILGASATGAKNILNLTFKAPSAVGTSTITASGTVVVISNSSQVNGGGNTVTYSVKSAPTPTPTPKPAGAAVKITSTSHTEPTTWYKSSDVALTWEKPAGVKAFSYDFDQKADTVPDDIAEGVDTSKTYATTADGTWYFHIKSQNDVGWGSASHFEVKVDTTAPDPFTPTTFKDDNGKMRLYYSTADKGSGVADYKVVVDGAELNNPESGVELASYQTIVVTATDKAGNIQEGKLSLSNDAITVLPTTKEAPAVLASNKGIGAAGAAAIAIVALAVIVAALAGYKVLKTNKSKTIPLAPPTTFTR